MFETASQIIKTTINATTAARAGYKIMAIGRLNYVTAVVTFNRIPYNLSHLTSFLIFLYMPLYMIFYYNFKHIPTQYNSPIFRDKNQAF